VFDFFFSGSVKAKVKNDINYHVQPKKRGKLFTFFVIALLINLNCVTFYLISYYSMEYYTD
jgi:hypothetical protein